MIDLRKYQKEATDAGLDYFLNGSVKDRPILVAPTGSGKSIYAAFLTSKLGTGVLVLQPSKELLEQNYGKFKLYGGRASIFSASMNQKNIGDVTFATIGSIKSKPEDFTHVKYVIIDECFVGDTLIMTKNGYKPIKNIVVGDEVFTKNGLGLVEATSVRNTDSLYRIVADGKEVLCTPNHPFFTDKGWVEARHLVPDMLVYKYALRQKRSEMLPLQEEVSRDNEKQEDFLHDTTFSSLDVRSKKNSQPSFQERGEKEDFRNSENNETQTAHTRRERKTHTRSREKIIQFFNLSRQKLGEFFRGEDIKKTESGLSSSLQNRHSESKPNVSYRDRWSFPLFTRKKKTGQKERVALKGVRVESVSFFKRGDSQWKKEGFGDSVQVYNLQLSNHPSYFASDFLVHNCHLVPPSGSSMYMKFLSRLPDVKVIGLTATPFRLKKYNDPFNGKAFSKINLLPRELPRFFNKFLYVTQIRELYDTGFLAPIKYIPMEWDSGKLKVNTTGAEFTDESIDWALKDQQVHERLPNIIKQSIEKGRKYRVVFVKSIEQAIELSHKVPDSACVHSGTKKKDREKILTDFKAGKIKTVFNVGVLTVGFDFPALDTIIIARPTMSLALYMQMVGRGMRPCEGKTDCALVEMCGNYERFGKVEDIRYFEDDRAGWIIHNGVRQLSGVRLDEEQDETYIA